jgi:hypothetical protein
VSIKGDFNMTISVNGIFGDGNLRPANNTTGPIKAQPFGVIKLTGLDKTANIDNDNMYPDLNLSKTPGNTGINEKAAKETLGILDFMDSFVIKP